MSFSLEERVASCLNLISSHKGEAISAQAKLLELLLFSKV